MGQKNLLALPTILFQSNNATNTTLKINVQQNLRGTFNLKQNVSKINDTNLN